MTLDTSKDHAGSGAGNPGAGPSSPASGSLLLRVPRARGLVLLLAALCVLLGALDIGLAVKVRRLVGQVDALSRVVRASDRPLLCAGDQLPALTLFGADGQLEPLRVAGQHTQALLLISSPSCEHCEGVRPTWDAVARLVEGSHMNVLELVLERGPAELPELEARKSVAPGGDVLSLTTRLAGVPAALLIDESGRVLRAFYGDTHDGLREAVEEALLR